MPIQDKPTLKSYFETGDTPTQDNFADFIDSLCDDTAYSSAWNGSTDVAPSQNAVYDKIELLDAAKLNLSGGTMSGDIDLGGNSIKSDGVSLDFFGSNNFSITNDGNGGDFTKAWIYGSGIDIEIGFDDTWLEITSGGFASFRINGHTVSVPTGATGKLALISDIQNISKSLIPKSYVTSLNYNLI
jgi:hypothetical protein